jgi:hypothetical protein
MTGCTADINVRSKNRQGRVNRDPWRGYFYTDLYIQNTYMKSSNFWHITPCTPLKVYRWFGGICCLDLQGRTLILARNHHEAAICLLPTSLWFLAWLIVRPWRRRRYVPPKHRVTFNGQVVISQNMNLFIVTVVRTSNPTSLAYDFRQVFISVKTS